MRLLIVLPQQQAETGNYVTALRLQAGLQERGVPVELLPIGLDGASQLAEAIARFHPDRLLLLHAWRCGRSWLECPAAVEVPTTVLLTGTDINHDIDDKVKGPLVNRVLLRAAAIVSQNRLTVDRLRQQAPAWIDRLHYIEPGIRLGSTPYPLRQRHGISRASCLFLHPAGIRPVKANLELLLLCDPLAAEFTNLAVAFCGPPLDPDYFRQFLHAVKTRPWAHYLGVIPTDAMPAALAEAELILNHSLSEGLSNALLEALAVGRPILARDIPGNAALLNQDGTGWLYASDQEFVDLARAFLATPAPRRTAHLSLPLRIDSASGNEADAFFTLLKSLAI